jgi:hypothetical protein
MGFGPPINNLPAQTSVEHVRSTRLFRKSYLGRVILIPAMPGHWLLEALAQRHLHDVAAGTLN